MESLTPFYNPSISYEDNYAQGPFGLFTQLDKAEQIPTKSSKFLNHDVNLAFGIPAGPLLNANYIKAAFAYGFDLCVYKTVRTKLHKCHPLPNVLSVHPKGKLSCNLDTVLADTAYNQPLSITNSFGVPSFSPDIWQPDMADAVKSAGHGQYVIGSFQGTQSNKEIENDYALAAKLVRETNAPILEANLSCPNEGASKLLCFDIDKVERIVNAIKIAVPDRPLILKLAYFPDDERIVSLLTRVGSIIDGLSTINTLSAKPVDAKGNPALGENRKEGGVCGNAIRWAGLDMVSRLAKYRKEMELKFAIVGVGGVSSSEHYRQFIDNGADAVMSATGAMWNPMLAIEIKKNLK
ncbi:dihydroorotate oxidase [Gilliamella sp. GillExp13]|uniref:dihydroorotate oxidase n=1 Tax=Gilliamella sp. GillExp13 TaxID=3120243 RepID=UPI00080E4C2F|nr:dihydroorotate oxidase [Gilliamella apicola]OCG59757.1 dihydroorotate oxidase [Gilliamella apicola]